MQIVLMTLCSSIRHAPSRHEMIRQMDGKPYTDLTCVSRGTAGADARLGCLAWWHCQTAARCRRRAGGCKCCCTPAAAQPCARRHCRQQVPADDLPRVSHAKLISRCLTVASEPAVSLLVKNQASCLDVADNCIGTFWSRIYRATARPDHEVHIAHNPVALIHRTGSWLFRCRLSEAVDKKEAQKRNASNFAMSRTAMERGKGYRSVSLPCIAFFCVARCPYLVFGTECLARCNVSRMAASDSYIGIEQASCSKWLRRQQLSCFSSRLSDACLVRHRARRSLGAGMISAAKGSRGQTAARSLQLRPLQRACTTRGRRIPWFVSQLCWQAVSQIHVEQIRLGSAHVCAGLSHAESYDVAPPQSRLLSSIYVCSSIHMQISEMCALLFRCCHICVIQASMQ